MSFFYAKRDDKNGNLLLTSYNNLKSAEKYGGADANITEELHRAEFSDDGTKLKISPDGNGDVVRSYMKNASPTTESGSGRFVLVGKLGGVWRPTEFRFDSYGTANTLMKSLIGAYEALVVLDQGEQTPARAKTSFSLEDL